MSPFLSFYLNKPYIREKRERSMSRSYMLVFLFLLFSTPVYAGGGIPRVPLDLENGAASPVVDIVGNEVIDYAFDARAGQRLTVTMHTQHPSAYFNIFPADLKWAFFVGSTDGDSFDGVLSSDGTYIIRVYLMRSAARRNEVARCELKVQLSEVVPAAEASVKFEKTLELQGITFHVEGLPMVDKTLVRVTPSNLEIDNRPSEWVDAGRVTGAEVADLNADGSPEVYVYLRSNDASAKGALIAYSANRRKSISQIYLSPIEYDEVLSAGYRGHDEFAVVETSLVQRFPVYQEGDTDQPSGGMRQVQYKLVPGEAGWLLKVKRVTEY